MDKNKKVTAKSAIESFTVANLKAKNDTLIKRNEELRQTVEGHKELAKVFTAYIAHLLRVLGTTEDNPLAITDEDVKYAIDHYETRAIIQQGERKLYCAEINKTEV